MNKFISYNNYLFESSIKKINGTILFTDIIKSSELWKEHEKEMYSSLDKQNDLFSKIADYNKGEIIKTIGDAFMIHFENLIDAVKFSIEVQKKIKESPLKVGSRKIQVRIGFCYGPLLFKTNNIQTCKLDDYYGNTVNTASRLESKVSPENGFAFGSLIKFDDKKIKKILDENCTTKIIKFTENAKDIEFKRSGRLLTKTHRYIIKDVEELKGVNEIEVYKCNLK